MLNAVMLNVVMPSVVVLYVVPQGNHQVLM
jgi:hypothetical protein